MSCHFCYNAHVWAKEPHNDEDYFDEGLHDKNDFSSCTIGDGVETHQIYLNSGNGEACNIEICEWMPNICSTLRSEGRWVTVAKYYPKFCPECGRKLDEYAVDKYGRSFERLKDDR